jgi:hypothetical protein
MKLALQCNMKQHKARWGVTVGAGLFLFAGLLAELFGGTMTRTMECLGSNQIAAMLAIGNALTMVP